MTDPVQGRVRRVRPFVTHQTEVAAGLVAAGVEWPNLTLDGGVVVFEFAQADLAADLANKYRTDALCVPVRAFVARLRDLRDAVRDCQTQNREGRR